MQSRRSFFTAAIVMAVGGTASATSSTPVATPAASPVADQWRVVGEGILQTTYGQPELNIDLTYDGSTFEGGFSLTIFPSALAEWVVESSEFVDIRPVSDLSPHVTRITGYATLNGSGEQPFVLDLTDGRSATESDALNFAYGQDAAPFLGEEVKLDCDCGPAGIGINSPFIEGGVTVTRG